MREEEKKIRNKGRKTSLKEIEKIQHEKIQNKSVKKLKGLLARNCKDKE